MNAESEVLEAIELKVPSVSPTIQSDLSADGDTSTMQISNSDVSPSPQDAMSNEPKAKKRRKQSNPLKIQNPTSPKFDLPAYELGEQEASEATETASYPFDNVLQGQNNVIEKSRTPDSGSQKGSLSRVTDALFNSKLREAAKASTNSSKSKDSSLQSLTDLSSPESSEEMSSNNDFKSSMQIAAYPQLPPMLPINPVDIARDTMKLSNVYPFAEFSSSMQHGNMNLSVSQRSFVTSSGVRVFNPEAYCELCEKEFCNKYFLKTHKANKHGICSVENNNTSGYSYKTSYKNMQMNPQAAQQMITQMCENGATFGSADSYCNICQKYFCNKYFLKKHRQNIHGIMEEQQLAIASSIHVPVISSPLPVMRTVSLDSKAIENSSGKSTKDEESKMNVSMENIKNSLNSNIPLVNGSSLQLIQRKPQAQSISQKEVKNEKFLCELCNIEFCDKCYLDAHKLNKHGQSKTTGTEFPDFAEIGKVENNEKSSPSEDPDEAKEFKGQMCAPCMKNFTSAEAFQHHMLETHGASLKDEDDGMKTSDLMHKKNGHSSFENEGLLDMSNKSPSCHEMDSSNSSTDSGSHNCGICMAKCRDKKGLIHHLESEHNLPGSAALELSVMQESITCEVCQEQFLDRIALLSHKFKAHGIVPPGLEAYSDGIENGEYSFYSGGSSRKSGGSSFCKFCNKELCNKYFLKTHMMKLHGIDVDKVQQEKLPAANSGGEYCDICQKFLCSKYFLRAHKQNVHGIIDDSVKLSMMGSPSYGNTSVNEQKMDWNSPNYPPAAKLPINGLDSSTEEALKRNNNTLFTCEICGQEFTDKIMLQFHLVNKHVKSSEGKVYPNSLYSGEDSKDGFKTSLLPCSCCSFVNLDDNAKLAQINNPEANLVISCTTCNVTYRLSDYHTHHLSHGVSLPSDKKPPVENGVHELTYGLSGNSYDAGRDKPRKFKRFRCSKCDMTFRTKLRCLHHIQVKHKSRKGLTLQCDPPTPSKKNSLNNNGVARKNLESKNVTENGTGLLGGKETEDNISLMNSCFQDPTHLPYKLPKDSDVIMQPFHLTEPKPDGVSKQNIFVPSLVYLPVSQKVSETLTVAFTLTPA